MVCGEMFQVLVSLVLVIFLLCWWNSIRVVSSFSSVVLLSQMFGVVWLFRVWISQVQIVGVKLLKVVVVRLQVREKFVVCMFVGIILVNVIIIVLLQLLQRNDSYNLMLSRLVKFGLWISQDSVGQVVSSVSVEVFSNNGLCLMWLENVFIIGSQMKLDRLMYMVISRLLRFDSCSLFLLKVGVQVVIRQNDMVVIIIIVVLVSIMLKFCLMECSICDSDGWWVCVLNFGVFFSE